MTITKSRNHYKPFEYPWCFEFYRVQNQIHWLPEEVPLADDVYDWKYSLSAAEKNLITQIFRFFTQGDVDIAKGYIEKYMQYFPVPEVRMMLSAFANTEAIHAHAYSLLLDTLGMDDCEYKAFQEYEEMSDKHEYLFETENDLTGVEKTAFDLAKFSAFGEGLQLFSSFVILMNFQRFSKMRGMGQIVAWSVRDESLHVEAMTKVFDTYVRENIHIWTDDFKGKIYECARQMVALEDRFIDLAFSMGPVEGLDKEDLKRYIRYLADRRLLQLGLKPNFKVKDNPLLWFEETLLGVESTNFFENKPTEYSKGVSRNWEGAF